jgi:hypothetical protein
MEKMGRVKSSTLIALALVSSYALIGLSARPSKVTPDLPCQEVSNPACGPALAKLDSNTACDPSDPGCNQRTTNKLPCDNPSCATDREVPADYASQESDFDLT